jgi:anti-sigma-K factor RskA
MGCAELREVAPDVALGLLTGEERATALAHLQGCEACRAEVASLAGTADEVLLAAPEVSPPPGFGRSVLARLAGASGEVAPLDRRVGVPPAPRRWPVAAALGVAAALAVLALVAGLRAGDDRPRDPDVAVAEMLTGSGRPVGEASAAGDPATVRVAVPGWAGMVESWGESGSNTYWLSVELEDGTRSMDAVRAGREEWSVEVAAPADEVVTISVLDSAGRVWCTGRFAA